MIPLRFDGTDRTNHQKTGLTEAKTKMASGEEDLGPAKQIEIVDPHNLPIVSVDWLVTGGMHNDVANITLGTLDHMFERLPEDAPRVVVAAQLRFSRAFAFGLHRALSDLLGLESAEAPETSQAPLKNKMN
jgi:hypothetical protein